MVFWVGSWLYVCIQGRSNDGRIYQTEMDVYAYYLVRDVSVYHRVVALYVSMAGKRSVSLYAGQRGISELAGGV